jgi:mannosyl-3-phosphoglycerate phosphatase
MIFTDLDGTLLNEEDYSLADAMPALARIERLGIPLIIATSKTRAEVEALQRELGMNSPFITENGGGIFLPTADRDVAIANGAQRSENGAFFALGVPYAQIRSFLKALPAPLRVRGFGDMAAREVAEISGLTLEQAALSKQREFTEPFLVEDAAILPSLEEKAVQAGLQVVRGGRFHHLIGAGQDKGRAVRIVRETFAARDGWPSIAVGLGDSENDLALLAAVDIPVLIPRPQGSSPEIRLPGLVRATEPGSRGWNSAVERLLDRFHGQGLNE